jgi:hypothetical protein
MDNIKNMALADLVALKTEISEVIKGKRESAKADEKALKAKRDAEARATVAEGDTVSFILSKKTYEGKVLRVNDKTVTVEFEKDGETITRYRKFSDILSKVA